MEMVESHQTSSRYYPVFRKENWKILSTFLCCHPSLLPITPPLCNCHLSYPSSCPSDLLPSSTRKPVFRLDLILVLASSLIVPLCFNSNVNKIGISTKFIFLSTNLPHIFPVVNVSRHQHLPAEDWTRKAILDFFCYHTLRIAPEPTLSYLLLL